MANHIKLVSRGAAVCVLVLFVSRASTAESAPVPSCKAEGVKRPSLISRVDPEYSKEARNAKYQGTVVLNVIIQKDGAPGHVDVAQPLGMGLDEKAIEAVKQWRFRPATRNGDPLDCADSVTINFQLR